jgi:RNA polymerase sigma factor (sigma-70 family)
MGSSHRSEVLGQLDRLWAGGTAAGMSETQLLESFAAGDQAAFAALAARHGPMVYGVCRRLLADTNDADDAFQATFLVLAKKATSIRPGAPLANWLHGVARRIAARAGADARRRRRREAEAATGGGEPDSSLEAQRRELAEIVHSEIDRLSSSGRAVVVLCDLAGCTHEEAASRLGWPLGTVKGRHFRARSQLRSRLQGRGVSPASALAVISARTTLTVPTRLVEATARAACAYAAGHAALTGLATTHAISLAKGTLLVMITNQIQWAAAATMTAALFTASAAVIAQTPAEPAKTDVAAETPAEKSRPVATPEIDPKTSESVGSANRAQELNNRYQITKSRLQKFRNAAQAGVVPVPLDQLRVAMDRYQKAAEAMTNFLIEDRTKAALRQEEANAKIRADLKRLGMKSPHDPAPQDEEEAAALAKMDLETTIAQTKREGQQWKNEFEDLRGFLATGHYITLPPRAPSANPPAIAGRGPGDASSNSSVREIEGGAIAPGPIAVVGNDPASKEVARRLEGTIALKLPEASMLSAFLDAFKSKTMVQGGRPLLVYVDSLAIGNKLQGGISLDLEGVPARMALKLALRQLGLVYLIRDGMILITTLDRVEDLDAFLDDDQGIKRP